METTNWYSTTTDEDNHPGKQSYNDKGHHRYLHHLEHKKACTYIQHKENKEWWQMLPKLFQLPPPPTASAEAAAEARTTTTTRIKGKLVWLPTPAATVIEKMHLIWWWKTAVINSRVRKMPAALLPLVVEAQSQRRWRIWLILLLGLLLVVVVVARILLLLSNPEWWWRRRRPKIGNVPWEGQGNGWIRI